MTSTGIHVIDTTIDNPSTALLINEGPGTPTIVDITPLDGVQLAVDLLEALLPDFMDSASGLRELNDWADRLSGIGTAVTAALPSNPHVVNSAAFAAGRITPEPGDLVAHSLSQLATARENLDRILGAADGGERG